MSGGVIANVLVGFMAQMDQFKKDIADMKKEVGNFANSFSSLGVKIAAIWASLHLLKQGFDFVKASIQAFAERETVIAKLNASLVSTGNTVGMTTKQLVDLGYTLMNNSKYSVNTILQAEQIGLMYSRLTKDTFPKFMQLVVDAGTKLSQTSGNTQDLSQISKSLGKALEEPYSGLGRLSRMGITVTNTFKEQIKTLMEHGKVLEAQKVLFDELQKKFGGQALAALNTYSGAVAHLKNMWEENKIRLGAELVPVLKAFIKILEDGLSTSGNFLKHVFAALAGIGAGIVTFVNNYKKAQGEIRKDTTGTAKGFIETFKIVGAFTYNLIAEIANFANFIINTINEVRYNTNKNLRDSLGDQLAELEKQWAINVKSLTDLKNGAYVEYEMINGKWVSTKNKEMAKFENNLKKTRDQIYDLEEQLAKIPDTNYKIKKYMSMITKEEFGLMVPDLIKLLESLGKIEFITPETSMANLGGAIDKTKNLGDAIDKTKDKAESLNKAISKFKDFFNSIADVIKEALIKQIEYNFSVWEGTYKNLTEMLDKQLEEDLRLMNVFFEEKMRKLDEEKKRFELVHDQKMALAEQEYNESIVLIDKNYAHIKDLQSDAKRQQELDHQGRLDQISKEADAKMKDFDAQIKAIDDLTAAEEKAQRSADRDERLTELWDQMKATTDPKEYAKLLKEYNKEVKDAKREELLEFRESEKDKIRASKDTIQLIKDNLVADENYKYQIVQDRLLKEEKAQEESYQRQKDDAKAYLDYLKVIYDEQLKYELDALEKKIEEENFMHQAQINEMNAQHEANQKKLDDENKAKEKERDTALEDPNLNKTISGIIKSGNAKKWLDANYPGWDTVLKPVGEMLYDSLIVGLSDPAKVLAGLQKFFNEFMKSFRTVFDAHSPSKKIYDFSIQSIGGAIEEGLNDSIIGIVNAADNIATAIKSPFDGVGQQIATDLNNGFKSKLNFAMAPEFGGMLAGGGSGPRQSSDGKYIITREGKDIVFDSWNDYLIWGRQQQDKAIKKDQERLTALRTKNSMAYERHQSELFGSEYDPSRYNYTLSDDEYNALYPQSSLSGAGGNRVGGENSTPGYYAVGTLNINSPNPLDPYETARQVTLAMQKAGAEL